MTAPLARVPCTIVTGFLGAGKTTLIRHVLENANGRRLAVIVNEFGDVGIDGEILKGCGDEACPEENIVELANGCLCCTVADEFVPALDADPRRASRAVEHIVIETSGLALPKPLVQAFHWPAIKSRVTVDGVVAVVDGAALAEGRVAADLEALAAPARGRHRARSRRSGRGGVRGPDRLRRSRRAQQARPARRGAASTRRWRAIARRAAARGARSSPWPTARSIRRRCSGSASAPRTTSRTAAPITTTSSSTTTTISTASSCALPEIGDPGRARRSASPRVAEAARRAAHEGLRGGRGQADAAAGAGGRAARQPSLRPALGGGGAARGTRWW